MNTTQMQHCNTKVFERIIKISFPVSQSIISSEDLTDDEENALRYAAGYVIRSTYKKINKACHPHKRAMLAILNSLKEDRDDRHQDTYLFYTKLWINKVN